MATLRGVVLAGIALAGLVLFIPLMTAGSLIGAGVGLFLLPPLVVTTQRLINAQRGLAGAWFGVPIPIPYRPSLDDDTARSPVRRLHHLLGDRANWRDALWLLVNSTIGIVLTTMPLALLLHGVRGLAMPFDGASGWLGDWYAFVPITGSETEWLAALLGLAQLPLALWVAPHLLHLHARLAAMLLSPTEVDRLTHRVQHLTETREDAVGREASELRRVERNLHDGAQTRLVAVGMTLDAAMRVLSDHPEAARSLLTEAKDSSAKALQELRSLVRGIQPPVLVDRGLADAIRTLAMENPLHWETAIDIPQATEAPRVMGQVQRGSVRRRSRRPRSTRSAWPYSTTADRVGQGVRAPDRRAPGRDASPPFAPGARPREPLGRWSVWSS